MKPDRETLQRLIPVVDVALKKARADAGAFGSSEEYPAWRRRFDDAVATLLSQLVEEGATFTYRPPHDHAIRLAGIRSSSTGGDFGAVGNWLVAARKRLEGAAA